MKLSNLLLATGMSLSLVACGGESGESANNEARIGEKEEVKNKLEYEIFKLDIVDKVEASQPGGTGLYYEPNDKDKKFLDLVLKVKNTSSDAFAPNEVFEDSVYLIDGSEFTTNVYFESEGMTAVDAYGEMDPNEETFVHIVSDVKEDSVPEVVTLDLHINGTSKKMELNRKVLKEKKETIQKGEVLSKENKCNLTLVDAYITNDVSPSNPDMFYTHYQAEGDNMFIVVKYLLENTSTSAIDCEDMVDAKVVVNGKYNYEGFVISEENNGENLSSYNSIDPLEKTTVYSLIEIPNSMSSGAKYEIKISAVGTSRFFEFES